MGLKINRKSGDVLRIGEGIVITFSKVGQMVARLDIVTPPGVRVEREEVRVRNREQRRKPVYGPGWKYGTKGNHKEVNHAGADAENERANQDRR